MVGYSHERYAKLIEETLFKVIELGKLKGGEYAGDDDRLANFRRNGTALGLPMETVWAVYYNKHHDAVMQYIKDLQHGKERVRLETIEGRVNDLIVYLLLFKAMVEERESASLFAKAQAEDQIRATAILSNESVARAARLGAEINKSVGYPFKKPATVNGDFGSLQPTET